MNSQSHSLGIKHLIECHCTLKIYEKNENIQDHLYHKFCVYSNIDESGKLIEKIVKCNNCSTLHKVYDYCKSELVEPGKDTIITAVNIDDIKLQLSSKLVKILEKYDSDIATWEQVLDIVDKEVYDQYVVLSRQVIDQKYHVKVLQILNEDKVKIVSKIINDEII